MQTVEANKTTTAQNHLQLKRQPFFNKEGQGNFFSRSNKTTHSFFSPNTIQPKLTIGQPNDKYEVEADATADKVVQRLSETSKVKNSHLESDTVIALGKPKYGGDVVKKKCSDCEEKEQLQKKEKDELLQNKLEIQRKPIFESNAERPDADVQAKPIVAPVIQAKCSSCEQEGKLQKKEEQSEDELDVQAKSTDYATGGSPDLQSNLNSSKGNGSSLSPDTQSSMGSAFGADFSKVRVHTGSEAVQMNKGLGAQAFTHGNDIYFNEGKYDTHSNAGKHLLAHELTHTVQQGASVQKKPDVQLEEEVDKEELERQIRESNKEQKDAYDPSEAIKTQNEAVKEGEQAEQLANEGVPEVEPAKPEPLPDVESDGSRVAIPVPKKPDVVVPAAKKNEAPKPADDSTSSEPKVNGEAPASGPESTEAAANGPESAEVPVIEEGGETLKYLENQSAGVCNEGAKKSQELADNESAHDTAEEKTAQTDVAVEPPKEEGQSRSNADQVNTLDAAEKPKANDAEIKSEMNKAISEAVPSKVKELNEFESEKKAQVIGNKVLAGTTKQVGEIQGTYNEIETAPPPAESAIPEALPEIEKAPDTTKLNLGKGAVPAVPKEQTDLSNFEEEADGIYEKEGVSKDMQAEFENVDSGDIAEANKEKTTLKEKVANEPANLQSFAAQQQSKVETDLQTEEERAKGSMEEKRKNELNGAKIEQEKTKSELEIKRENVTKWINDRYKLAEGVVTKKLSNLETEALSKFDTGQKKHSKQFEGNVKRRVNAWKSDRYSGFWGGAKWVKDKFVGIDHFPKIKQIFTSERETFVKAIDRLIVTINLENEKTIKSCKDEIVNAKKEIQKFITELEPELKEAGKRGQEETTKKLEALDKHVEAEKKKLQQKLCDKKDEAIKAIDKKIEEMKSEMSGLVGKLGALLLYAAKKFFKWAIEKIGGSADKIIGLLDKGATVLKKLFTDPIGFFKNLVKAVGGGIKGFVTNIVSWLKKGLVGWLMGQMGDSGLELPKKFDMKGIIFLGLQVAGLTWNVIRPRIVKGLGPKGEAIMTAAEKGVDIIKRVIKEGPIVLWEIIMEKAAEIKSKVMEGIRNWAITQIIKKMSVKLLSMLNPAGAIVQAILFLYDVVMFFVENWNRIIDFVKSVFDSIGAIASGAIGQASGFIEKTLGKTIPMILSFAARFVGLAGIGKAIRKVIETIQKPFKKILDKMIKFLVKQVKKLFGKGKKGAKNAKDSKSQKDHDKKVGKGLKYLRQEEQKHDADKDKKLTEEEAKVTAKRTIAKHSIFKSITPKKKGKKWVYEWRASTGETVGSEVEENDSKVSDLFNENKKNIHSKALQKTTNAIKKVEEVDKKETDGRKKIKVWSSVVKKLKEVKTIKDLQVKPFTNGGAYGTHTKGQANKAANKVLTDTPDNEKKKIVNEKISIVEKDKNSSVFKSIRDQVFDNSKEPQSDQKLEKVFKGEEGEHDKYKVLASDVSFDATNDGVLIIKYSYTVKVNDQPSEKRDFTVKMKQTDGNVEERKTDGKNIGIKEPGTRGKTKSASSKEARDAILDAKAKNSKNLDAIIKSDDGDTHQDKVDEVNKEKRFKDQIDVNTIKFNASHLIADWFSGSGYRAALNLVTTSEHYNKKTMKDAEDLIFKAVKSEERDRVKNTTAYITFNMKVTAKMIAISDKSIANKIEESVKTALKSETPEQKQERLKLLHKELSSDKDPKFVKSVDYLVDAINEKNAAGETVKTVPAKIKKGIKEDVHLKEILRKL